METFLDVEDINNLFSSDLSKMSGKFSYRMRKILYETYIVNFFIALGTKVSSSVGCGSKHLLLLHLLIGVCPARVEFSTPAIV